MRWAFPARRLHTDCPLQILTKGTSRLLIGLRSPDLLGSLKPDFEELTRLTPHVGAEGYFVFALSPEGEQQGTAVAHVLPGPRHSRGSRSAAMPTACSASISSIMDCCTPKDGESCSAAIRVTGCDRPGIVDVEVQSSGKVAQLVKIVGDAVIVYEAEVQI